MNSPTQHGLQGLAEKVASDAASSSVLQPGDTCWRIETADRISFLVDGETYFHAFRETAKRARRSILILGWDMNSRFELEREDPQDGLPTALCAFLNSLVARRRRLRIHVLNWDFALIYALDREWLPRYRMDWSTHRRLHFRADGQHPTGASQHQKIVVIDDNLAFLGGLDFALGRWDSCAHLGEDERRRDFDGVLRQPYHDVQMMVSGPIATALAELARERWRNATGQRLKPVKDRSEFDPWPQHIAVDLHNAALGIVRTYPPYKNRPAVFEVERLFSRAIAGAKHYILFENQYFSAHVIGDALAQRLAAPQGPEVVVILPEQSVGWLSQHTMDVLRERLVKKLRAADHHGRLRVYYPAAPDLADACINLHSKVMIIDDDLLRVGSANLNNRSMRLDSECDLALEACADEAVRQAIREFRARLLGEHLHRSPHEVLAAMAKHASLIGAIESLRGPGRSLAPLPLRVSAEVDAMTPEDCLADPEQPLEGEYLARQLLSPEDSAESDSSTAKYRPFVAAAALVAVLLLAAAYRWTPLGQWLDLPAVLDGFAPYRNNLLAPVTVLLVFILGALLLFPVTLLIFATGLLFGVWPGFFYALLGAELSALLSFGLGRRYGHSLVGYLPNYWPARVHRRLKRLGLLAVLSLRLVPVAPFTVVNLVAGTSPIRLRDFALGTGLGMAPGILVLTLVAAQVVAALTRPATLHILLLVLLALIIAASTWWLGRVLLRRHDPKP